jgi:hypothetical protein
VGLDGVHSVSSEFLATDPEVRVRFPTLPDFLRSSGSGRGPLSFVRIPATDPEVRVRFPTLPHFLRSSGSGRVPLSLVRVPGYRSRGPGSIPDATTFSEK